MELICYNKGCGKTFTEEENTDGSCTYHQGGPIFHDAMKGWSCCNKKSTDFTVFLNTPGCTKGKHNPVKPVQPEKVKCDPLAQGQVIEVKAPKPKAPIQRPPEDTPTNPLKINVGTSLKSALARLKLSEQNSPSTDEVDDAGGVQIGTKCKHNGCGVEYTGPETDLSECRYHPGTAIFHEGYKFWTCCQKRTSDFNEFMKQAGCKNGDHIWKEDNKKINCRYDWHQTGSQVVVSIYAKCIVPEETHIDANATNISVSLSFEGGKKMYTNSWRLRGVIDPDKSIVDLLGTKAEIKMRKAEIMGWKTLHYEEPTN